MAATADPLQIRLTRYIPHEPHMPQAFFLSLPHEEVLYGGAAGGGKSDALLMAALQYVDVPGYSAILFRRTFPDLDNADSLIPRSKGWLTDTDARWNGNDHRWTFPSGATLTFAHMQHEDSKYNYQGAAFQFIGFDELTQFTETQYRYLFSRMRKPDDGPLATVPLRMRASSNPGGSGHRWVKRRFIDKLPDPDDPEETPERVAARLFVPARLPDNPSINQESYLRQLAVLDPQTRKQLLDGDWNAREPGDWVFPHGLEHVFELGAQHGDLIRHDQMAPPVGDALILAADWGVHSHILMLWPLEHGGFHVHAEVVGDATREVSNLKTLARKTVDKIIATGYPVYHERFDASMPVTNDTFLQELKKITPLNWRIKWLAVPFSKFKAPTIDYLRLLVANTVDHLDKPTGLPGPMLSIDEKACPVLADQIRQWRYADPDINRTEKGDDHGPDALVAGAAPQAAKRTPPKR
jgi:hypothetical protein